MPANVTMVPAITIWAEQASFEEPNLPMRLIFLNRGPGNRGISGRMILMRFLARRPATRRPQWVRRYKSITRIFRSSARFPGLSRIGARIQYRWLGYHRHFQRTQKPIRQPAAGALWSPPALAPRRLHVCRIAQTMRHIASRAELWFEKPWFPLLRCTPRRNPPIVASVAAVVTSAPLPGW